MSNGYNTQQKSYNPHSLGSLGICMETSGVAETLIQIPDLLPGLISYSYASTSGSAWSSEFIEFPRVYIGENAARKSVTFYIKFIMC